MIIAKNPHLKSLLIRRLCNLLIQYDNITSSKYTVILNDYHTITSTNYTDNLNDCYNMILSKFTYNENNIDINIPKLLLTIPCGISFFMYAEFHGNYFNQTFIQY